MVIWSALRSIIAKPSTRTALNAVAKRNMSGHENTMPMETSRWQWNKFKDFFHYYIMVGLIPVGAIITYTNVFIGPATLTETPEDYVPKHWEYYRHPISRFLARYVMTNPQQEYEKLLHHIFEEEEKRRLRRLENEIKEKLKQRQDYQAYYYMPITAKYHRATKDSAEYIATVAGD